LANKIPPGAETILDPSNQFLAAASMQYLPKGITPGEYAAMPPEH